MNAIVAALARRPSDLGDLPNRPGWQEINPTPGVAAWTDDYSNILGAILRKKLAVVNRGAWRSGSRRPWRFLHRQLLQHGERLQHRARAAPAERPMSPKRRSRWISRPPREAAAKCTSPTGLPAEPPPGPAMPVIDNREIDRARARARPAPWPRRFAGLPRRNLERRRRHAEHLLLGRVAVGDEAAVDARRTSRGFQ